MKMPDKINILRRRIMKSLTKDIGRSSYMYDSVSPPSFRKILISRPNGRLGNLLLLTPLVQEVAGRFPDSRIDLFVKGNVAPEIFRNYDNVDQIIQLPKKPFSHILKYINGWIQLRLCRYDLVINASENSSSGRLSTVMARSKYKFFGEGVDHYKLAFPDYFHSAKYPVYNLRGYLLRLGFVEYEKEIPSLNLILSAAELVDGNKILDNLVGNERKTICLFTNATGNKCYSSGWWNEFYNNLEKQFPEYNIIEMLPVENISRLGYRIPALYSTQIREMAAIIANTSLFIAADSGVMHLASAAGTPTIGLFSVTNKYVYAPYNRDSIAIDTNEVNVNEMFNIIKYSLQKASHTSAAYIKGEQSNIYGKGGLSRESSDISNVCG